MKNFSVILSAIAVLLSVVAIVSVSRNKPVVTDDAVSKVLLNNPSIIVEAQQAYQEKLAKQRAAAEEALLAKFANELNSEEGVPFVGPKDAKVTVVEFFDFSCGYCKRLAPTVATLVANNADVKFVFKPVAFVSRVSQYQAKAGIAAHKQGKFIEFYKAVMASTTATTEAGIDDIAKSIKLDMDKYKKDLQSDETKAALEKVETLRANVQVNGVPSLFMNGKRVNGFDAETIQNQINGVK